MKLQLLAFWLSIQQNCLPLLSSKHPHRPRQWAPGCSEPRELPTKQPFPYLSRLVS